MSRKKSRGTAVRIVTAAIIDAAGTRWDKLRTGDYYASPIEVEKYVETCDRFLVTAGYGSRVVDVAPRVFHDVRSANPEHRVQIYKAHTGDRVVMSVDSSDC